MEMIKKLALVFGILLFSAKGFSQEIDTLKIRKDSVNVPKRTVAYATDKIAIARPLNIEFSLPAPYNFSSKRGNTPLQDGRVNDFTQLKVSANVNFLKKKHGCWVLLRDIDILVQNQICLNLLQITQPSLRRISTISFLHSTSLIFYAFQ